MSEMKQIVVTMYLFISSVTMFWNFLKIVLYKYACSFICFTINR